MSKKISHEATVVRTNIWTGPEKFLSGKGACYPG